MTGTDFDRLRPRTPTADTALSHTAVVPDIEGKRALFSSVEMQRPTGSGISIECARCGETTQLTPAAALRAAFPAVHLSIVVGYGEREAALGLFRRRQHGSWLRCPACGRGAWTRVTVRL